MGNVYRSKSNSNILATFKYFLYMKINESKREYNDIYSFHDISFLLNAYPSGSAYDLDNNVQHTKRIKANYWTTRRSCSLKVGLGGLNCTQMAVETGL